MDNRIITIVVNTAIQKVIKVLTVIVHHSLLAIQDICE
jgi:hypothetical protein